MHASMFVLYYTSFLYKRYVENNIPVDLVIIDMFNGNTAVLFDIFSRDPLWRHISSHP